jgi:hypothetical protein
MIIVFMVPDDKAVQAAKPGLVVVFCIIAFMVVFGTATGCWQQWMRSIDSKQNKGE